MKRSWIILMVMLILLLSLLGCWNRRELQELAIAGALGIDLSENGYQVSVQIINPGQIAGSQQGGGGQDSTITTYVEEGRTVSEAIRKLTKEIPRMLYLSHLRMVIISEDFARQGLNPALDMLNRHHEMRSDFYIAIAQGTKAENILKVLTSLEKIPANYMFSTLEKNAEAWASSRKSQLDQLMRDLVNPGKSVTLTGIMIKGPMPEEGPFPVNLERTSPYALLAYTSQAVFREDTLVGWLKEKESRGYNFVIGEVEKTIVNGKGVCTNSDEMISLEIIRLKSNLQGHVQNGEPHATVSIHGKANVVDIECALQISENEIISKVEHAINKTIEEEIKRSIKKAQEDFQTDIFGFGNAIERADHTYWKSIEDVWDEMFTNLEVKVNVDIKVQDLGTIVNPFTNEIENRKEKKKERNTND